MNHQIQTLRNIQQNTSQQNDTQNVTSSFISNITTAKPYFTGLSEKNRRNKLVINSISGQHLKLTIFFDHY